MSIDPYKGVRDFYPEDQRIQNHLFSAMRRAVESYGYEEMNASVLEPTELYRAKTSEEIVNDQTYTFTDRGDRSVTLRPEMTPTVARMVATRKRELGYPLRWYSIQNFFRYERPQRGRLREFWQLNADLFGVPGIDGDLEVLQLAHTILKELGASDKDFVIKIGSRSFLDAVYDRMGIAADERAHMTRALDGKDKGVTIDQNLLDALQDTSSFPYFAELQEQLQVRGVSNAIIDPTIARGFDYYTGMVFEVFDTHEENKRSLFGGGRYDTLIEKYGPEALPAVGFAMGDVIARDFLETHHLLATVLPSTHVYLAPIGATNPAEQAARTLRTQGVNVALGLKHEKLADHLKHAAKLGIPYFIAFGENELASGSVSVRRLSDGTETVVPIDEVRAFLIQQS